MPHAWDPSSPESSAIRARTASEVLFLDALDVAARRGWAEYLQMMIVERALQHLAVLEAWSSSTVAVPPMESKLATPRSDNPDNSAGSRWPLFHRLRGAILVANRVSNLTLSLTQTTNQGDQIKLAIRVLDSHARSLRRLPDSLREVIDRELCVVHRRFVVSGAPQVQNAKLAAQPSSAIDDADDHTWHARGMAGLALSGGGVRSASYSIGTLQTLARVGLLRSMDYVSAVSGGSWAAGWLVAWAFRHEGGIGGVEDELKESLRSDCAPLRWVRRHIAYLAPRPGVTSGDSWGLLVAYISNWLPILALASLSLLTLILVPHVISAGVLRLEKVPSLHFSALAIVGLLLLILMSVLRRLTLYYRNPGSRRRESPIAFVVCILTLLTTVCLAAIYPLLPGPFSFADGRWPENWHALIGPQLPVLVQACGLILALNGLSMVGAWCLQTSAGQSLVDGIYRMLGRPATHAGHLQRHPLSFGKEALAIALSSVLLAVFGTFLLPLAANLLPTPSLRIAFGPMVLLVIFASAELFGMLATSRRDVDRAWSARVGGWMLATVTVWTVATTGALGVTALLRDDGLLRGFASAAIPLALLVGVAVWLVFRSTRDVRNALGLAAALGLLALLLPLTAAYLTRDDNGRLLTFTALLIHFLALVAILWPIALACNVNRFALHSIYKQGLVRTFLGASRLAIRNPRVAEPKSPQPTDQAQFRARRPDPATNIDEDDNPPFAALRRYPSRELPVMLINAAVNGISRSDQDGRVPRQWPFTFSQRHCGSPADGIGYTNTDLLFADDRRGGVSLGGAMAVSGAAVSPTSGSSTRPLRALLLGVLNARLGMWIGNPRNPAAVRRTSPAKGGLAVLGEMLGMRVKFGDWLHLSDGGHFENLGVYELVRRGCMRIIAIDASCDPKCEFDDLSNLIRRARIDLDVHIFPRGDWCIHSPRKLDTPPGPESPDRRGWMWFDVQYGPGLPLGRLLYIKPSVYDGDNLRPELLNYWRQSPAFPHESTMNQFFTEQQMEAYRGLGESNMDTAMQAVMGGQERDKALSILIKRSA